MTIVVRSATLRSVLGQGPFVCELRGVGDPETLVGRERAAVTNAVAARQREFAAGRACARAAARYLGQDLGELLSRSNQGPMWPADMVGSITHCTGFAGAAVAPSARWRALGIDAEPAYPLPAEVVDAVLAPAERTALAQLPREDGSPWDRIAFSAKESLYKAWSPLCRTWLGFKDAEVRLSIDGSFGARILLDDLGVFPRTVSGRWVVRDGIIATGLALPRRRPSPGTG